MDRQHSAFFSRDIKIFVSIKDRERTKTWILVNQKRKGKWTLSGKKNLNMDNQHSNICQQRQDNFCLTKIRRESESWLKSIKIESELFHGKETLTMDNKQSAFKFVTNTCQQWDWDILWSSVILGLWELSWVIFHLFAAFGMVSKTFLLGG